MFFQLLTVSIINDVPGGKMLSPRLVSHLSQFTYLVVKQREGTPLAIN